MIWKMISWKYVNNKKCAPKLVFFNEKMRKIQMIFDIENWLWKSNFGTFWQLAINPKLNNFLWVCWFLSKNLSNFVSPIWKLQNPYCHTLHVLLTHLLFTYYIHGYVATVKVLETCWMDKNTRAWLRDYPMWSREN